MADDDRTPSSRRQTVLIGTVAVFGAVLLFVAWYFFLRMPYAPAFTGINSTDAVTITQELDRLKTPYELADEGATILVPEDKVDAARISVLGGELPLKGAVGFELFNKSDMGLTEFAQKINFQRALQGELARTIMALEQVDTARVHLSLPETGIFEQDSRAAKASVTIATKLGGPIDPSAVLGIQQLIASAVPDLQSANVAVLNAKGELLNQAPVETIASATETPLEQRRADYERAIAGTVEEQIRANGLAIPLAVKVTALRDFSATDDVADNAESTESPNGDDDLAGRTWPLNVQIEVANELAPSVRTKLLNAARQAMVFDTAKGDVLLVLVNPALNPLAPPMRYPQPGAYQTERSAAERATLPASYLIPVGAALLFLLLLVGLWRWLAKVRKPMQPLDRDDFATRLKTLIEEDRNGRQSA